MDPCSSHQTVDCDCESVSLSNEDITLPKIGQTFRFKGFLNSPTVQIDETINGLTISARSNPHRFHGSLFGQQMTGLVNIIFAFSNTNIPGSVNTGLYNTGTGIGTAPNSGAYLFTAHVTTTPGNQPTVQFVRQLTLLINGTPFGLSGYKSTSTNAGLTTTYANIAVLNAGDTFSLAGTFGEAGVSFDFVGGVQSTFSVRALR